MSLDAKWHLWSVPKRAVHMLDKTLSAPCLKATLEMCARLNKKQTDKETERVLRNGGNKNRGKGKNIRDASRREEWTRKTKNRDDSGVNPHNPP